MVKTMHHGNGDGNMILVTMCLIGTVILEFISRFKLTDWASMATLFAGASTGALAIYRFYKEYRRDKNK